MLTAFDGKFWAGITTKGGQFDRIKFNSGTRIQLLHRSVTDALTKAIVNMAIYNYYGHICHKHTLPYIAIVPTLGTASTPDQIHPKSSTPSSKLPPSI